MPLLRDEMMKYFDERFRCTDDWRLFLDFRRRLFLDIDVNIVMRAAVMIDVFSAEDWHFTPPLSIIIFADISMMPFRWFSDVSFSADAVDASDDEW